MRRNNLNSIKNEIQKDRNTAIVIGGSLSGLMVALALAEEGIQVSVLEKAIEGVRAGAGLRVDGSSFSQSKTEKKLREIVSQGKSTVELWTNIEARLRQEAHNNPKINLYFDTRVIEVNQNETLAWAKTNEDVMFEADILIGADGHSSMVRDLIAPHHQDARFAGYLAWMASVSETELPNNIRFEARGNDVEMFNSSGGFMFASVIESDDKIKRVGCTWYDNTKTSLLERLGAVEGKLVHHSLKGSDLEESDIQALIKEAQLKWPEPWKTITTQAIESRNFIGIPIKEYVPEKLVDKRLALVGDAAHVPAPITASGFNESLKDAAILSDCLAKGLKGNLAITGLKAYESRRLKTVQDMVRSGQSFSRSFGNYQ